jgi:sugar phosphate isomerase/epimerase
MYPRIYLAIDNCFASKRWTTPQEWCDVIASLGVRYVEASADTELDPLYMGEEYLADWALEVKKAGAASGLRVVNCYSGHGTYSTLGLTHTDPRVRRRMIDRWFKPMIDTAAALGAGLGFFAHAFPQAALESASLFAEYAGILEDGLVEINRYAAERGCGPLSIEQMYTPHQYPWQRSQTKRLIQTVTKKSGRPFYFTEDLGHHSPVFQDKHDADCYAWLSELGCYSPIIHLQQTDGKTSSHYPFTKERNAWGRIDGGKVIAAIKESYDRPVDKNMPRRCEEIYLTLEVFMPTAAHVPRALEDLKESVDYWREFVPGTNSSLYEISMASP